MNYLQNNDKNILPWHKPIFDKLMLAKKTNRLPHALLLSGFTGMGKAQFANHFARYLLCQHICEQLACYKCHDCHLIEKKTHPNILWINPENENATIKIDQIRASQEFIYQTSAQGYYRVVIINSAHCMNINAANALLKMLEEPPAGVIIILIANQQFQLPLTILSRCQKFIFSTKSCSETVSWLKEQLKTIKKEIVMDPALLLRLTYDSPLLAIEWVEKDIISLRTLLFQALFELIFSNGDPTKIAATFLEMDIYLFIDFILIWTLDILRLQFRAKNDEISNVDFSHELAQLKSISSYQKNIKFIDYLKNLRKQICENINFNPQLLRESVLIRYKALYAFS